MYVFHVSVHVLCVHLQSKHLTSYTNGNCRTFSNDALCHMSAYVISSRDIYISVELLLNTFASRIQSVDNTNKYLIQKASRICALCAELKCRANI